MAVTYGFFNSVNGDRKYNADQMSSYFDGLVIDGVYEKIGDALIVKAGTGMQVSIGKGRAVIRSKWFDNDASYIINLNPAHATLNRYTAICLRLNLEERKIDFYMKDSADATTPVKPAMEDSQTVKELCLAYIYVKRRVTEITQADITDTRANTQICGWVTGLIRQVDTSQLFLQWQDAYEKNIAEMDEWKKKQQDSFDEWFRTLTDQLNVKTKLYDYKKAVTLEEDSNEIHIGDNFYNQDDTVLYANINGIQLVEGVDYTIEGIGAGSYLKFKNIIETGNIIEIRTMRSIIG